jgi:ketosteroid isomerase-like protein
MRATLILAAAVLLTVVQAGHLEAKPSAPDSIAAEAVRALEPARGKALVGADTAAIAHMTADEFVEISRLGQLRTKADNLREIGSGALKLTSVKYDEVTVDVYGDVAILRGVADNTGVFRGMPFAGKIRYTRVFVRRDGRWQAVAMQHTMMP